MNLKDRCRQAFGRLPMIPQYEVKINSSTTMAVNMYLKSGGWMTEHTVIREFEDRLAQHCRRKFCVCVPSGTMGLILAVRALMTMVGKAFKIAVPDFTHPATANAIAFAGCQPIPIDIEPETWGIGSEVLTLIEKKVIGAVVLVDINGRIPKLIKEIEDLCMQKGVFIIEDACQALGSNDGNKIAGSVGEISVLSFSPHKIITTGQGGAILTDDEDIYRVLRRLKDFGRDESGGESYPAFGINAKFTDLQAVTGLAQMALLDDRIIYKRNLWYDVYGWWPHWTPWFLCALPENRAKFRQFCERRGVGTRDFYPALHTLPMYANWTKTLRYPEATNVSIHGVWLPSSFGMADAEINRVRETINDYIARYKDVKLSDFLKEPASAT